MAMATALQSAASSMTVVKPMKVGSGCYVTASKDWELSGTQPMLLGLTGSTASILLLDADEPLLPGAGCVKPKLLPLHQCCKGAGKDCCLPAQCFARHC